MALDISNMLSKNIILVDAKYIDNVASDFGTNFERMLNRSISNADLALWLDCIALDGGIEPGENEIQVIFIHNGQDMLKFSPSNFADEIDGKAFKDNLGEFTLEAYKTANDVTTIGEQFAETLRVLIDAESVENVLIVPNMEMYGESVKHILEKNKKQVTLFSIQPQLGAGFSLQQLGFSVMHALGIRSEEFQN